jgi:signal transduction histidine kinase/CheY-like chemotaxis protein
MESGAMGATVKSHMIKQKSQGSGLRPAGKISMPLASAMTIGFGYLAIALSYIWASDYLVDVLLEDPRHILLAQSLKGSAFMLITAIGLTVIIYREMRRLDRDRATILEQEHILSSMVESLNEGLVVFSDDGQPVLANEEAKGQLDPAWLFAPPEEGGHGLFRPDDGARHDVRNLPVRRALRGERVADETILARNAIHPDGFYVSINASPIRDESGEVTGAVAAFRDVTASRRMEAQLNQSQKMEAVGQLTGGIAHDFNNLLTVILGNADTMAGRLDEPDKLRRLIETTRMAALRGADLTQRLLSFARGQALHPASVCAHEIINGMTDLLRRSLGGGVELDVRADARGWRAFVDPSQLENALLNLVLNARDAMPDGGHIVIETKNITVKQGDHWQRDGIQTGDYVMVAVTDTGEGMTPDVVARVFEPFFTTKGSGKGSGLGLSMVYGFVTQSKGYARVCTRPGDGTTMRLFLPRAGSAIADPYVRNDAADDALPNGIERILYVEDDALVREYVEAMLCDLGYEMVSCDSGEAALAFLEAGERFDLLFTDIVMPGGMDGHTLVEKALELQGDLRVLLTTGYADAVDGKAVPEETAVLNKPFRREDLAQKLRCVLAA